MTEESVKVILHIDINSYFATLLQQENPFLRDRPLGVVKDTGRTCLIATSKEAKRYGIKTGVRLADARRLFPNLTTVAADFDRALDSTRRLRALFHTISPDVQIFSLDEAFIDLTHCQRLYPDPLECARRIQDLIKQELGEWVTCSIGISHTRLLAKIGSGLAGPDGVLQITTENRDAILARVTFEDVCGIGYRLEKKLHQLGVTNPYAIRLVSDQDLQSVFGPFWSQELRRISWGEESHILELLDERAEADMKSVGRSITGWKLCGSEKTTLQTLHNLLIEAMDKARSMRMAGRQLGLGLSGEGQYWSSHRTLQSHIYHTTAAFDIIKELYAAWPRDFKVIKFRIWLSGLERWSRLTPSLLPTWQQQEKIETAIASLNQRYGLFTVKPASLIDYAMLRPEVTGFLGDKKYWQL